MDGESLATADACDGCALTEIDLAHPLEPTRFQRAFGLDETSCNAAVLRDDRWTCVHFNGGLPPILFDRAEDLSERRDVAGDPGGPAETARLRRVMLDLRMQRADRRSGASPLAHEAP